MAGEMALIDPGYAFNGGCMRCANGSSPLYDTEAQVPYEGAMALCRGCLRELAVRAGLLDEHPPESASERARNKRLGVGPLV